MRGSNGSLWLAGFLLVAALVLSDPGEGFDDVDTHPRITEAATGESSLDSHLKDELALPGGLATTVVDSSGRPVSVVEWLRIGSTLEDAPACRARNHFHNPLRPFTSSGVTDLPFFVRLSCASTEFAETSSNVLWGTRFTSPLEKGPGAGNPFDWDAARIAFRDALIASAVGEREAALARTFETLGHVAHLVQDLAVPAHARNDFQSHLQYFNPFAGFGRWTENDFERFVRRNPQFVTEAVAAAAQLSINFVQQPLTRFWDLDAYTSASPSRDTDQGLAQYTNPKFPTPTPIFL